MKGFIRVLLLIGLSLLACIAIAGALFNGDADSDQASERPPTFQERVAALSKESSDLAYLCLSHNVRLEEMNLYQSMLRETRQSVAQHRVAELSPEQFWKLANGAFEFKRYREWTENIARFYNQEIAEMLSGDWTTRHFKAAGLPLAIEPFTFISCSSQT